MKNNDVLRRLRYTFNFGDDKMISIFSLGGLVVSRELVSNWLKKDDAPDFASLNDKSFACFLNGLIVDLRGARDEEVPKPETKLTNNMVLMKLKIALNLKAEDVLALLELANLRLSKHELSAFFRRKDHKQYRECLDQVLRNFLQGLQLKHHANPNGKAFDWGDH